MRPLVREFYRKLPCRVRGLLDGVLRPNALGNAFGGPFNGQACRRTFVERLLKSGLVDRVVETGSFRGDTTAFFASTTPMSITTIEKSVEFAAFTRARMWKFRRVSVRVGDSADVLPRVLAEAPATSTFIYLDAHWGAHLPLRDELRAISAATMPVVVLIDDFEVPGDRGYGFDDYGEAGVLRFSYIEDIVRDRFAVFWPAVGSGEETGLRRGCCVLGRGEGITRWLASDPYLRGHDEG